MKAKPLIFGSHPCCQCFLSVLFKESSFITRPPKQLWQEAFKGNLKHLGQRSSSGWCTCSSNQLVPSVKLASKYQHQMQHSSITQWHNIQDQLTILKSASILPCEVIVAITIFCGQTRKRYLAQQLQPYKSLEHQIMIKIATGSLN